MHIGCRVVYITDLRNTFRTDGLCLCYTRSYDYCLAGVSCLAQPALGGHPVTVHMHSVATVVAPRDQSWD